MCAIPSYAEVLSQPVPALRGPASVPDVDERRIRSVVLGFRHSVVYVVSQVLALRYLLFAHALIAPD
jgi:hypothetical protein